MEEDEFAEKANRRRSRKTTLARNGNSDRGQGLVLMAGQQKHSKTTFWKLGIMLGLKPRERPHIKREMAKKEILNLAGVFVKILSPTQNPTLSLSLSVSSATQSQFFS